MHSGVEIEICEETEHHWMLNNTQEKVIFKTKQMFGILDLRSLGYYKIRQGVLQQNLSKCYHLESAEKLYEEFNMLVNELKEDEKTSGKEKYPWLEDSDERKHMTYRYTRTLYRLR